MFISTHGKHQAALFKTLTINGSASLTHIPAQGVTSWMNRPLSDRHQDGQIVFDRHLHIICAKGWRKVNQACSVFGGNKVGQDNIVGVFSTGRKVNRGLILLALQLFAFHGLQQLIRPFIQRLFQAMSSPGSGVPVPLPSRYPVRH